MDRGISPVSLVEPVRAMDADPSLFSNSFTGRPVTREWRQCCRRDASAPRAASRRPCE